MLNKERNDELTTLLLLATRGHYPLFFKEDLFQSTLHPISKHVTKKYAHHYLRNKLYELERHSSFEKKRIALMNVPEKERFKLINLFMKLVEDKSLDVIRELH